ncbi:MAG: hypothetical protein KC636_39225 [Myxococcales bacterium]|nr:hypothetical protein [Myxococcales bacterium]
MPRIGLLAPLCTLLLVVPGCGGDKKTDKKADDKKAEAEVKAPEQKADAPDEKAGPKTLEPGKVELPWTFERVSGSIELGTTVTYALAGKDAKGKDVSDRYQCKVKRASKDEVGVSCNTLDKPSKDKGAGQVAVSGWSEWSPFFSVEKPEYELKARETITVPAGEFDTVVAEIKGFFGAHQTVWMIVDKPGLYAKVNVLANAGAEGDQTNLVYELAEVKVEE